MEFYSKMPPISYRALDLILTESSYFHEISSSSPAAVLQMQFFNSSLDKRLLLLKKHI